MGRHFKITVGQTTVGHGAAARRVGWKAVIVCGKLKGEYETVIPNAADEPEPFLAHVLYELDPHLTATDRISVYGFERRVEVMWDWVNSPSVDLDVHFLASGPLPVTVTNYQSEELVPEKHKDTLPQFLQALS